MVDVRLTNDFSEGRVISRWVDGSFAASDQLQRRIERTWQEALAAKAGVNLFDGPMCRLETYSIQDGVLLLDLSRTSYKAFMGTNMALGESAPSHDPREMANPVGLSCALVCDDGALVLGRRNEKVAYYPGRVHPFAGAMEPGDGKAPPDVFDEVRRELTEELGMNAQGISEISCIGLVEDQRLRQPELIFRVRTAWKREQIARQVDEKEHRTCVFIEADEASVQRLLEEEPLTPVAVGTVRLWGKRVFGERWFAGV